MNNNFWTVVGFTIRNKFRGKAFLITTLIIAVIISIGINLPYIISQFSSGEDEPTSIGYVETKEDLTSSTMFNGVHIAAMLNEHYSTQEKAELKLVPFADTGSADSNEKELKKAIVNGKIDGYIEFKANAEVGFPDVIYKSEKLMEGSVTQSLQTGLAAVKSKGVLQDAGLSAEQTKLLMSPVDIDAVQITTSEGAGSIGQGKTPSQQAMDMGLVYVIIILLFMAIMITGQLIASEITAEKSSRVMEILITSVSPLKSMFGKIFGMFIVGLTQIVAYVAVIVINMTLPHNAEPLAELNIRFSDIDPFVLIYALIFYLAGYFLFATLFAAVGSIVSRTEDLGQAVLPITMLSLAGFYICMFGGLSNPDSMLIKVSSFIPLFSPYAMVVRLGLSDPPLWQVWASIIILLVTIYVAGWISARIYRAGVLMYGKRPSFKELRKAMKAYKV
ncbi:ABC transporter permease [Paenibacillus mendelii]|uniref:ABC transporter permease n=1 Tax=Paenibacillus mendelii TaxID=206163 RepID=A0ABV6J2Y7_9BACL|nr:ABC transporter permease [Paenibacillus mendelii]MCQ6559336.1 ABC transporter permease [Paenibacillus mendelii]